MNQLERSMVEILVRAKANYGVISIKAEFEAEGTRLDELLRLVDVSRSAGLSVTVKIGGCEAIRDLLEAKQVGVRYVVAPMIETPYAVSKFISAKNIVFNTDEKQDTDFLINLETITGFDNRQSMVDEICKNNELDGLVFGRVDFVGSLGWSRESINDQKVTDYAMQIAKLCLDNDKQLVIGGGISIESLDAIRQLYSIRLDRFETRKVIFDAEKALQSDIEQGLIDAVHFELLWLMNKRDYYSNISNEDKKRIEMLTARFELIKSWKKGI